MHDLWSMLVGALLGSAITALAGAWVIARRKGGPDA